MIDKLIEQELEKANKKFPKFNSKHEAYGVLAEEMHEAILEIDDIIEGIQEDYFKEMCGNKGSSETLSFLSIAVKRSIEELIQVGAMIKKAMEVER
jgi:hypothetical protein